MRVGAKAPLAGSGLQELTEVNSEDHDREERTRRPLRSLFVQYAIFQTSPSEKKRFEKEIRYKVGLNYIYNLIIDKEHNTLKFDVCVEFNTIHNRKRKTTVAFQYIPVKRALRLITIT